MERPLYQVIASLIDARANCLKSGNNEWSGKHTERLDQIARDLLPSGSGWDCATRIDLDASTANCIVLEGDYHHINAGGYYDGWTAHRIIVRPSLQFGFTLRITGRDRNDIKDYLHDVFSQALSNNVIQDSTEPFNYKPA